MPQGSLLLAYYFNENDFHTFSHLECQYEKKRHFVLASDMSERVRLALILIAKLPSFHGMMDWVGSFHPTTPEKQVLLV